jgi:surface polysaccharide O-acyltransferase-like enzyme
LTFALVLALSTAATRIFFPIETSFFNFQLCYVDRASALASWLSARSFGAYVLHPPVIIALTLLFRPLPLTPFLHIVLLTTTGLAASFAVADLAKRVRGLRRIL